MFSPAISVVHFSLTRKATRMEKGGWPQFLESLTGDSISWHPLMRAEDLIIRCGDFPNVPLIGSKGCINYNPILAMRQLGRSPCDEPEEESLRGTVVHDKGIHNPEIVHRIIRAWENVHKIKGGLKRKGSKETYSHWVKARVQKVKIPFLGRAPSLPIPQEPLPMSIEETEALKATVARLREEKEELDDKLLRAIQEKNAFRREGEEKDQIIRDLRRDLKLEKAT